MVEQRPVQTGITFNNQTVVTKGLQVGETVVTDGQLRLAPKMKVTVKKSDAAANTNSGRRQTRHERSRAVHPPPGDDHAGHVGHSAFWPGRFPPVARQRSAERGLSDGVQVSARPARRESGDDGFRRRDAAGKTTFHQRGRGLDVFHQLARQRVHHDPILAGTATLTRRRRTCRRPSPRPAKQLPPNMPTPPTYQKVIRRIRRSFFCPCRHRRCRCRTWTITAENLLAQQISQINGVAQVSVFGAQPYAVRIQVDPEQNWRLTDWGLIKSSSAVGKPECEPAARHALRENDQAFTVQANGQLTDAAAFRPMIVAYRNGNPGAAAATGQRPRQCAKRQRRGVGGQHARRHSGRAAPSRARIRSRWWNNIKKLLPQFRKCDPGVGEAGCGH